MNILFWNLHNIDNTDLVKECLTENDIDLAVFCEHKGTKFDQVINKIAREKYVIVLPEKTPRIQFLVKSSLIFSMCHIYDRHITIKLTTSYRSYSITGVHLQDRLSADPEERKVIIRSLMSDLTAYEEKNGISNTIIIGDFNSNPYNDEMLQFDAFNAVLFKEVIRRSDITIYRKHKYRRLYNPILNYIKESDKECDRMYGSYYYSRGANTPYWFCLDQVLLGKSLIDSVTNVKYLKKIGTQDLINKVQLKKSISDHLPLLVVIDES